MTEPTEQDIAIARRRMEIAKRFQREYQDALALAEQALGPGWKPTCTHSLVTHDEAVAARKEGRRAQAAAVVYTAEKDSAKRHFMVIDGRSREVESYQAGFGAMLTEPDPNRTIEVKGRLVHPHRYELHWSGFEGDYRPKTAVQLAEARANRERKAEEKEQQAIEKLAEDSLFPEWIKEQAAEQKKGRKR